MACATDVTAVFEMNVCGREADVVIVFVTCGDENGDCDELVLMVVVFDCNDVGVAGTGGMTGRANCASNELTTPSDGARIEVTDRDTMADGGVGVGALLLPEFCSNCLSSTFCDSSGFECDVCTDGIVGMAGYLWLSPSVSLRSFVVDTVLSDVSILSSLLAVAREIEAASMLLCRLATICAGVSLMKAGSSIDLERRNKLLLISCECSSVLVDLIDGWVSCWLRMLPLNGRPCKLLCSMFWMAAVELDEVIVLVPVRMPCRVVIILAFCKVAVVKPPSLLNDTMRGCAGCDSVVLRMLMVVVLVGSFDVSVMMGDAPVLVTFVSTLPCVVMITDDVLFCGWVVMMTAFAVLTGDLTIVPVAVCFCILAGDRARLANGDEVRNCFTT